MPHLVPSPPAGLGLLGVGKEHLGEGAKESSGLGPSAVAMGLRQHMEEVRATWDRLKTLPLMNCDTKGPRDQENVGGQSPVKGSPGPLLPSTVPAPCCLISLICHKMGVPFPQSAGSGGADVSQGPRKWLPLTLLPTAKEECSFLPACSASQGQC